MKDKKQAKSHRPCQPSHVNKLIEKIEVHAAAGRHMFLLPPGSKVPASGSHGFKDATNDAEVLIKKAKEQPNANLALRTGTISALLAIDIDRHGTTNGFATLAMLEKNYGELPVTKTTKTAGNGEHRLFVCREAIRSSQNLADGVDVRADDGYILVPPSVVEGVSYSMKATGSSSIAELPKKWLALLRSRGAPLPKLDADTPIVKGARNIALTSMAFDLRREGKSRRSTLAQLRVVNETRCQPPEADTRLVSLVDRVFDTPASGSVVRAVRQTTTLASIDRLTLKPLRWAIRKILPEGVALLAGPPKIGKSILMLQMGLAVATGQKLWRDKAEKEGEVLYIAYEDNDRRMQKRARQLLNGNSMPSSFHVDYDWPRMDAGGIQDLDNWLIAHPKTRLVIIDTLAKFRGEMTTKRTAYDFDYSVGQALVPLSHKHHVAIVLVHHTAKGHRADVLESVNSTNGLPGGVDSVMVLGRERGCEDGFLFVTGRDIEEERSWAMTKTGESGWAIVGSVADAQRSGARQAILDAIKQHGANSPAQLATYLGKKGDAIRQLLMSMIDAGEVKKKGETYIVSKAK